MVEIKPTNRTPSPSATTDVGSYRPGPGSPSAAAIASFNRISCVRELSCHGFLFFLVLCTMSYHEKRFQMHATRLQKGYKMKNLFVRFPVIPEYYIRLNESNIIYIMS
jgi:hypothetical protein